ncbi:MAG: preprotein translocase subunit YajC [Mariprofundaceae bacterium]|nr:preprotein translocase subunit YajC [Mariprofundaceae bacterium]
MKNIMRSIFISMAAMIASTSPALAADAAGASGDFTQLIPLIIIMVIFYFLLIRPQQKRAKEHRNMVESLKKGDKVLTNGGIYGTIMDVKEGFLKVEIAEGVRVKIQRDAVAALSD